MTTQAAISGHEVEHSGPNYIAVFHHLSVLTAVELGVYAMGLPQVAKVGLLIALAWAKAVVAMYFMHLAMEKRALAIIADHPRDPGHVPVLHAAARYPHQVSCPVTESARWVRIRSRRRPCKRRSSGRVAT